MSNTLAVKFPTCLQYSSFKPQQNSFTRTVQASERVMKHSQDADSSCSCSCPVLLMTAESSHHITHSLYHHSSLTHSLTLTFTPAPALSRRSWHCEFYTAYRQVHANQQIKTLSVCPLQRLLNTPKCPDWSFQLLLVLRQCHCPQQRRPWTL